MSSQSVDDVVHSDSRAAPNKRPQGLAQEQQTDGRGSVTLNLPQSTKDLVTREGRESLSAAVRGLIRDRISLFEMPRPARLVLERDMAQQGITDQRDYVVWLLLERHRHLLGQGRSR